MIDRQQVLYKKNWVVTSS